MPSRVLKADMGNPSNTSLPSSVSPLESTVTHVLSVVPITLVTVNQVRRLHHVSMCTRAWDMAGVTVGSATSSRLDLVIQRTWMPHWLLVGRRGGGWIGDGDPLSIHPRGCDPLRLSDVASGVNLLLFPGYGASLCSFSMISNIWFSRWLPVSPQMPSTRLRVRPVSTQVDVIGGGGGGGAEVTTVAQVVQVPVRPSAVAFTLYS